MKNNVYFVTGIDTDAGKSYATGVIAREWNRKGKRTITQKLIQTGNVDHSEDIELHRKIMGIPYTEEDDLKLTMPEIFTYPASPHLASQIDCRPIDFDKIIRATKILSDRYEAVLVEGAGGIMVPLTEDFLTVDYIEQQDYPIIFVTSGKLGSINHTLLSLELIKNRKLKLALVAYNLFPESEDQIIQENTETYIQKYLMKNFPTTEFIRIPVI